MSLGGDDLLFLCHLAAHGTILAVTYTVLGTCGCLALVGCLGVSLGGDSLLLFGNGTAYRAMLAVGHTVLGTCGCLTLVYNLAVSLCGCQNLTAD